MVNNSRDKPLLKSVNVLTRTMSVILDFIRQKVTNVLNRKLPRLIRAKKERSFMKFPRVIEKYREMYV